MSATFWKASKKAAAATTVVLKCKQITKAWGLSHTSTCVTAKGPESLPGTESHPPRGRPWLDTDNHWLSGPFFFNWSIISLQCCAGLCHTATRINYRCVCVCVCQVLVVACGIFLLLHVESSSLTRNGAQALGAQSLRYWTTKKVPLGSSLVIDEWYSML